jgi:cytoskeletal protein CcmA (bactofilin family)
MIFKRTRTIIAEGLKIVGSVTAEGMVEINGHIEGNVRCKSLLVSPKAAIKGDLEADCVVVNGRVEGNIRGSAVALRSRAHVVGDIEHKTLSIEKGAYFAGRSSARPHEANGRKAPERLTVRLQKAGELKATHEPANA